MKNLKSWIVNILAEAGLIESSIDVQYISFNPVPPYSHYDCTVRCHKLQSDAKEKISNIKINYIKKIDLIGNYFNICFNYVEILPIINKVANNETYGISDQICCKKIIVEHTSITPVYPINLATYRSSVIGNAIDHTYSMLGSEVDSHFFLEDTARQLNLLLRGIKMVDVEWKDSGKVDHSIGKIFYLAYLENKKINANGETIYRMFPFANDKICLRHNSEDIVCNQEELTNISKECAKGHAETLRASSINVEFYDLESEIIDTFNKSEFIRGEEIQDLIKNNRLSYSIKNAIYYAMLMRNADRVFSVISKRQREVISTSISELKDVNKIKVVFYGDVVIANSQNLGLDSIREGCFNSVDQYITEVSTKYNISKELSVASLKYQILKCKTGEICTVSKEPYETIQMILKYSTIINHLSSISDESLQIGDMEILKEVFKFEDVVSKLFKDFDYSNLITYLEKLCDLISNYMDNKHIEKTLAKAICRVLHNSFEFIGIDIQKL